MKKALRRIGSELVGMSYSDMTTAEKNIFKLLEANDILVVIKGEVAFKSSNPIGITSWK